MMHFGRAYSSNYDSYLQYNLCGTEVKERVTLLSIFIMSQSLIVNKAISQKLYVKSMRFTASTKFILGQCEVKSFNTSIFDPTYFIYFRTR